MRRSSPHIAELALQGRNPTPACKCPRTIPWCRGDRSLNGDDAAAEFTHRLLPGARRRIFGFAMEVGER